MKVVIIIICVIVVIAIPMLFVMFNGMGAIKKLIIQEVDLSKVSDGNYTGSFHKGRWIYDVEVAVKDHKIVSIKNINQKMDKFKEFNDKAEAEIIAKQSVNIDVVSGATVNTKAFGKAVENALNTGNNR